MQHGVKTFAGTASGPDQGLRLILELVCYSHWQTKVGVLRAGALSGPHVRLSLKEGLYRRALGPGSVGREYKAFRCSALVSTSTGGNDSPSSPPASDLSIRMRTSLFSSNR